jgi:hypothetical protein
LGGSEDDIEEGLVAASEAAQESGRLTSHVGEHGGTIKVEINDRGCC